MKIAIFGTGYVGLVTGVALAEIGHDVTCIDVDENKVRKMAQGISPIFEPGLKELMTNNIQKDRLRFTVDNTGPLQWADVVYIAVGTPEQEDGHPNLSYIEQVALTIAEHKEGNVVVVTKSTVPVGTNEWIETLIQNHAKHHITVDVVSNPEFLREGSAVHDAFYGDRIIIGAKSDYAAELIENINEPFQIPIYRTDLRSAEMIKYASNAFLATKVSFINEIGNLCGKLEANITDVAKGIGMDKRIGEQFLRAGIGFGGSCFPKDLKAITQMGTETNTDMNIVRAALQVNEKQKTILINLAKEVFSDLRGRKLALLGLAFKPNTNDMRNAASIAIAEQLIANGADVIAYDPVATEEAQELLPEEVEYANSLEEALQGVDAAFIITEWEEFSTMDLSLFNRLMKEPVVFDGRNCFSLTNAKRNGLQYYSIGRPAVVHQM
ncbi:UDP-glucose dehydrogenase family protein [Salirhabdus salicampi]|uniref:UDP-glucose dehydrogenase family protein n=1 Tax=Salirhabdus salicampi TaxID=476102 RepID=UPI0020C551C4|nr:UDP-glucose/GDP-mannose dehydrogenase family protein [Salirhabdus salicampi]MCP8617476.1 UDP-glucose/GDP-mannose dehydrogenase family protein [Salirhabdus salicampi]